MGTCITTYTGVRFNLDEPDPKNVRIVDIAHHLSMLCRFTGAVNEFYSVAQHSVLVSHMCDPDHALEGLFHDGSETFTNDVSHFVKRAPWMRQFRPKENKIQRAVYLSVGLPANVYSDDVHKADHFVAGLEMINFLNKPSRIHKSWMAAAVKTDFNALAGVSGIWGREHDRITPWLPKEAEEQFWHRYHQILR